MTRVWIAQCLCPARHCILAAAGEADTDEEARALIKPLRGSVAMFIDSRAINPWCGLCKAPADSWTYEVGRTAWASIAEATPALAASAADQQRTAAVWGDLGQRKPH